MFCKNCGKQLEEGWSICPDCGAEIRREEQAKPSYEVNQGYQAEQTYQSGQTSQTYQSSPSYQYQSNQTYQSSPSYQYQPVSEPEKSHMGISIASMVLGIVGLLLSCILIGVIPCIIGAILALVALTKQKRKSGIAIAGLITSVVGIIVAIVMFVMAILGDDFSFRVGGFGYTPTIEDSNQDYVTIELTVKNRTGVEIWYLFGSESRFDKWGDDLLGDSVLPDGEEVTIPLYLDTDYLIWDFAMGDSDENLIEFYDLDFSECSINGATLVLEYDGTNGHARLY